MIKITAGKYGPKLLGKGTILELSQSEEERLVNRGVAEYCDDIEGEKLEEVFKTEDEIRSMKKSELIEYAKEIGVDGFDEESTKEIMVDSILNFIEENSEGGCKWHLKKR